MQDITDYITSFMAQKVSQAHQLDTSYEELMTVTAALIQRGGKRLRPCLASTMYAALGGQDPLVIIPLAASQELFHAFLLIHDDIIDRDTVRWGGLNVSGYYRERLTSSLEEPEANHLADASALLAGYICHSLAYEMVLASQLSPEVTLQALQLLQQTLFETLAGEVIDMWVPREAAHDRKAVSLARLRAVCEYKTARYSFCTPLQLGALAAGAGKETLEVIRQFATPLGIAYQIRDDLLGMFGDESLMGKPVLSDMQEGKHTILTHYAFNLAPATARAALERHIGNPNATFAELAEVREILISSGAASQAQAELTSHINSAKQAFIKLSRLGLDQTGLAKLEIIISSVEEPVTVTVRTIQGA
jgi:geranylgeranyl pyrophosphate synthase